MILVYTKTRFSWLNINFPQNGKMIAVHPVSQDKCILPLFQQFRNQSYPSPGGGGWRGVRKVLGDHVVFRGEQSEESVVSN